MTIEKIPINENNNHPSKTVLIAAGGTSGHIFPAIAIASELRSVCPSCRIVFSGIADSLEHKSALEEGFEFSPITAQNLPSRNDRRFFKWLFNNLRGIRLSRRILKNLNPDLVIGTGGYVSAPVIAAASMSRVPYVLHEQNSVPGRANRLFAKRAKAVFISYDVSRKHFSNKVKLILTGNPVRPDFYRLEREGSRNKLGIDRDTFVVLVMGGSLGARKINNAVECLDRESGWSALLEKYPNLRLFVSTGVQNGELAAERLNAIPHIHASLYFDDAPERIAACDFYVGRAGAMTCAEIAALGKPSMLIPYPHAADDHQTENARVMEEAGASFVCEDRSFDSHILLETIRSALVEKELLALMGQRAADLATPDASRTIADHIMHLLDENETRQE